MNQHVDIIGGGLAGCEAALQLAHRGVGVTIHEMRPIEATPVHKTDGLCELVCSNSLKSMKADSAAGMLKHELATLGSFVLGAAIRCRVAAGGALAVDRDLFMDEVMRMIDASPLIEVKRERVDDPCFQDGDPCIIATGPLTDDRLAGWISQKTGSQNLSFYDAAAPIVMADTLDMGRVFRQSRYEGESQGDYLNCPFNKEEYERFIDALLDADRVISRDFETKDLFQACQPVEEIARKGRDALRYGALKPVGLNDPATGHRPWAAVQLRAENAEGTAYNLVGFQTNLRFGEQERVFRMIPGLEHAEFARYGVMHRNTFVDSPHVLDGRQRLLIEGEPSSIYLAGQIAGTEGYTEAIASGLVCALNVYADMAGIEPPTLPTETVLGSLLDYALDPATVDYQPMHVNFGIIKPLDAHIRNKGERYARYAERGSKAINDFVAEANLRGFRISPWNLDDAL